MINLLPLGDNHVLAWRDRNDGRSKRLNRQQYLRLLAVCHQLEIPVRMHFGTIAKTHRDKELARKWLNETLPE